MVWRDRVLAFPCRYERHGAVVVHPTRALAFERLDIRRGSCKLGDMTSTQNNNPDTATIFEALARLPEVQKAAVSLTPENFARWFRNNEKRLVAEAVA